MINLQMNVSEKYNNIFKQVTSSRHRYALKEIYNTLIGSGDFNEIKRYFTNDFLFNRSLWEKIYFEKSFYSNRNNIMEVFDKLRINVKNIHQCSKEIVENFFSFFAHFDVEIHFQDYNQFLIDSLYNQFIGTVYLENLIGNEITINASKLKNNLIIEKFKKVNFIFDSVKRWSCDISVGNLQISHKSFFDMYIKYGDIEFDVKEKFIVHKYSNMSIDEVDGFSLFKDRGKLLQEYNEFIVIERDKLKNWIESEASIEMRVELMRKLNDGDFNYLWEFKCLGKIDQTSESVDDVSVGEIEDSNLYLYIFFIICTSLGIGIIVKLNDSHDSNEIPEEHLRNEKNNDIITVI